MAKSDVVYGKVRLCISGSYDGCIPMTDPREDMNPTVANKVEVIENYSPSGVDVGKMVRRMIRYAPQYCMQGLTEIRLLDRDPSDRGFACYYADKGRIDIFVQDIVGWQPWILRKTYVFTYLAVGLALGHELDHHVNRGRNPQDDERMAEANSLKYIIPSMGPFYRTLRIVSWLLRNTICRGRPHKAT